MSSERILLTDDEKKEIGLIFNLSILTPLKSGGDATIYNTNNNDYVIRITQSKGNVEDEIKTMELINSKISTLTDNIYTCDENIACSVKIKKYKNYIVHLMKKYDSDLLKFMIDNYYLKNQANLKNFHDIVSKLIRSVTRIHNKGLAHGDIKPENILVKGSTVITDIALADFDTLCMINVCQQTSNTPEYSTSIYESYLINFESIPIEIKQVSDIYALLLVILGMFFGISYLKIILANIKNNITPPYPKIAYEKIANIIAKEKSGAKLTDLETDWKKKIQIYESRGINKDNFFDHDLYKKVESSKLDPITNNILMQTLNGLKKILEISIDYKTSRNDPIENKRIEQANRNIIRSDILRKIIPDKENLAPRKPLPTLPTSNNSISPPTQPSQTFRWVSAKPKDQQLRKFFGGSNECLECKYSCPYYLKRREREMRKRRNRRRSSSY